MTRTTKALLAAFTGGAMMAATPVLADPPAHAPAHGYYKGKKHKNYNRNSYNRSAYSQGYNDGRYDQRVRSDTRIWRGDDGRYRCRRDNGTTGLLIGGAVGGLAGHEIAGRGDKLLGTIIGAAGGALLGREIDRDKYRCR